jgi:hypothetical protein
MSADYLVWSMEHNAWWAPDECGYTRDVSSAGRYTRERAREIAANPDPFPRRERAVRVDARHERVATANALIATIASCGRRFYLHNGRVGRIEIDGRGRLWFLDAYTGRRVYTAYRGYWRQFTEGGTLRGLVECLCAFVKTGEPLPPLIFGPWPQRVCHGDLWGYGAENMETIRTAARGLGMLATDSLAGAPVLAVDPSRSTPNTNPAASTTLISEPRANE